MKLTKVVVQLLFWAFMTAVFVTFIKESPSPGITDAWVHSHCTP